jgi:hypothetical protein
MATQTIVGLTPSGGTKAVRIYKDDTGRPCDRKDAHTCEVQEQDDDGNVLVHHTVDVHPESPTHGQVTSLPPEAAPAEGEDDDPAEKAAHMADIMGAVLDEDTLRRLAEGDEELEV